MISLFYQNLKRTYNIHIFRTNISSESDLDALHRFFAVHPGVYKWSVDLEDIDKVLRIESGKHIASTTLIDSVRAQGYFCEELD